MPCCPTAVKVCATRAGGIVLPSLHRCQLMDSAQHDATSVSDACTSTHDLSRDNEDHRTSKPRVLKGIQLLRCSRMQEGQVTSTHQYTACKGRAELFGPACRHVYIFGCLCCMQHVHSWAEDPLTYMLSEYAIECFLQKNQVTLGWNHDNTLRVNLARPCWSLKCEGPAESPGSYTVRSPNAWSPSPPKT